MTVNADNVRGNTVADIVASTGSRSEVRMKTMQTHDPTSIVDKAENGMYLS